MTETKREKLEREWEERLDKIEKKYREKAGFTETEVITEEMITKPKEMMLVNVAMHEAINSKILKEHILNKNKTE